MGLPRLLFSAHGLPKKRVDGADAYRRHVELRVMAIAEDLGMDRLDWRLCSQSRLGRLNWIRPYIEDEISGVRAENQSVVLCPIVFVPEHCETRVELGMEIRELVMDKGVPAYIRLNTMSVSEKYIQGLERIIRATLANDNTNDEDYSAMPSGVNECPCGTVFSGCVMMQTRR